MNGKMKGIIKPAPGPGGKFVTDIPIPQITPDQVLVKVKRTAICGTDVHIMEWNDYARQRVSPPTTFGHEFAGDVVEVGTNVKAFSVGDRVAGETHIPCNQCVQCRTGNQHICENMKILGVHTPGSFADYIAVPSDCLWKLDDDIDYDIGAMLEPLGVAAHGVLSGDIGGLTCAIYGCGPIGVMGVGVACASGASKLFAMDMFDDKLALAQKMGAHMTINTVKEDAVKMILDATQGRGVDVVVDFTGSNAAICQGFKMLKKGGRFTFVGLPGKDITLDLVENIIYKEAHCNGVTGRLMYKTWYQCCELLKSGKLDIRPVIGGIYELCNFEKAFDDISKGTPGKMIFKV